jgi:hypothetical protein
MLAVHPAVRDAGTGQYQRDVTVLRVGATVLADLRPATGVDDTVPDQADQVRVPRLGRCESKEAGGGDAGEGAGETGCGDDPSGAGDVIAGRRVPEDVCLSELSRALGC